MAGCIRRYTNYTISELRYKAGVYSITCKTTGKYYIGGAVNLYDRIRLHISDLLSNTHHNSYLQNAVNKYGIENFKFEVIDFYYKDLVFGAELWWINILDACNKERGYNINAYTKTRQGAVLSQKTKDKISKSLRGRKRSEDIKKKATKALRSAIGKSVVQLDLNGNFIKKWKVLSDAARTLGIVPTNITANAKGKILKCKKWIFVYADEYLEEKDYSYTNLRAKIRVGMYDLDDNLLREFNDVSEAAEFIGGFVSCIRAVYNNYKPIRNGKEQQHKTYKGYKWKKLPSKVN